MIKENLYNYKALVERVIDGDTIQVLLDLGMEIRIKVRLRLLGVNTPELRSSDPAEREEAYNARVFMVGKLLGEEILVHTEKSDSFGRYLATIYLPNEETSINDQLLEKGYAVPYER